MKKFLSIILALFIGVCAFGQISINGGYLHSSYRFSTNGASVNFPGNGFYIGVGYDIKLSNYSQTYFSPELSFALLDININREMFKDYFLRAPLHIKYVQTTNNGLGMFMSAGPSLICPLDGGNFDVTVGFEAGMLLVNNLKFVGGYDIGLMNHASGTEYKITRNIIHLGVGYVF